MDTTIRWLAEQCQQRLLDEKWLLTHQLRIGHQWKDRVNLTGTPTLNLQARTLNSLTISLVANRLAVEKLVFGNQATTRMIVRSTLNRLLSSGQLDYFQPAQPLDSLCELLARSIRDLRLAGVVAQEITESRCESPSKARDMRLIYESYCGALNDQGIVDYAACLELAQEELEVGAAVLPPALTILIPEPLILSRAEQSLMATLAVKTTVCRPHPSTVYSMKSTRQRVIECARRGLTEIEYLSGLGEVNEIRGVLQRILGRTDAGPSRLDQTEVLYTRDEPYVPLFLEQMTIWMSENDKEIDTAPDLDKLPVTFAAGIACVYSRPGRALRSWLRWVGHDCVQARAVQLLREGLLVRPPAAETFGYSRLATTLRRIRIGFRSERYLPKIRESIAAARESHELYQQQGDLEAPDSGHDDAPERDFGLPALQAVLQMVEPLVRLAPQPGDDALAILEKAREFVARYARAENKLDRYAREKLLDDLAAMHATLHLSPDADLDVLPWLEALPIQSRVMASRPRPGCLHVAPLTRGGYSGRPLLFVVGLDDARYPKPARVDPILLDTERRGLSQHLATSTEVAREEQQALTRAIHRALGEPATRICLSYASVSLSDDRALPPSTSMLELFRETSGQPNAHLDDLLVHLGRPTAFVSRTAADQLATSDLQLATLLGEPDAERRRQFLEVQFPAAAAQAVALRQLEQPEISAFDGLVPAAGAELDPTVAPRVSASRLETFGTCPRRFFFRYGLAAYPPDEWIVDPVRWLDALQYGNLVHALLEEFLVDLTNRELTPRVDRDLPPLLERLRVKIEKLQADIPVPNEDAFRRTCQTLEETCEIFLLSEEAYCRDHRARPWVCEASLGLGEPVKTPLDCADPIPLSLTDGRVFRIGGRLDRVDRLLTSGSERYAIWDYKSGSSYGFDQANPFNQGRKLQPFLYVGMLRHRIAASGGNTDAVETFGYFFPSPKTNGQRLQWQRGELRGGDTILRNICDLISRGIFVATTNPADCKFCDYLPVCGDIPWVTSESERKSRDSCNPQLDPWRELRGILAEGDPS